MGGRGEVGRNDGDVTGIWAAANASDRWNAGQDVGHEADGQVAVILETAECGPIDSSIYS